MITAIDNTKLEVLTGRIIRGLDYCNSVWQQARSQTDNPEQYERQMELLDKTAKRLQDLIYTAQLYGLDGCVFGQCKWDEDSYICFGCTKANDGQISTRM